MLEAQSQWLLENKWFAEYKGTGNRDLGFAYQMRKYCAKEIKWGEGAEGEKETF